MEAFEPLAFAALAGFPVTTLRYDLPARAGVTPDYTKSIKLVPLR